MIKKTNIFIILVVSLVSLYFVIVKDKSFIYVIKDISIILTINGLYIIQKLFKIKIDEKLNFIYILFIFIAHFLGVIVDLYTKVYWFDKFVHFLSGILSSIAAIYIIINSSKRNNIFNIVFIVSFSMLVASCWEIFEYIVSQLFNTDPQRVNITGISDTMGDIIVAFLGSILVSIYYYFCSGETCEEVNRNDHEENTCFKRI